MLVKTSELAGAALDWAVAKCEGYRCWMNGRFIHPECGLPCGISPFSTSWNLGGSIIEREGIALLQRPEGEWLACAKAREVGPTLLIAAMRCYVASRLGDEVEIPDELVR